MEIVQATLTTYAILTNLDSLNDKIQVALFLHVIDDNALRTYNGFVFDTPDDQRKISEVISKFDEFAIEEQNITFERFKFNQLTQSPGEQFETFLLVRTPTAVKIMQFLRPVQGLPHQGSNCDRNQGT